MVQTGHIIESLGPNRAMMKMKRMSACAQCGKCKSLGDSESDEIVVEVENSIGAEVGDYVEVSMDDINILQATALVYILPLIGLMLGVFITYFVMIKLGKANIAEITGGIVGIATMMLAYFILKANDEKFKDSEKFLPRVVRILIEL